MTFPPTHIITSPLEGDKKATYQKKFNAKVALH